MASISEIAAADRLSQSLLRDGERMALQLHDPVKFMLENSAIEDRIVRDYVAKSILNTAGMQAPLMADFLHESLDIDAAVRIPFAAPNVKGLYIESTGIVNKIYDTGSLTHLNWSKSLLGDYVLTQVDKTQSIVRPQTKWIRHVNADSCSWCHDQVRAYADTGVWYRHPNCKCLKVRKS